jgi:hypothetical protein
MTARRVAVLISMFAFALAGCRGNDAKEQPQATSTTEERHSLSGTFLLNGTKGEEFLEGEAGSCSGTSGYDDIEDGAQVTVTNEANTVIGTGYLERSENIDLACRFYFTVPNLPVAKFYSIEVSHRGQVRYSYEQMQGENWNVSLDLG